MDQQHTYKEFQVPTLREPQKQYSICTRLELLLFLHKVKAALGKARTCLTLTYEL